MNLIVAALLLTAAPAPTTGATTNRPFAVKYPNVPWFDPVYVADEKGWFAEEGLTIEWMGELPPALFVPAVAAGTMHVANRPVPHVLTAIAGGARLRIIAAGSRATKARPHMKYLVRPDSNIRSLEDLSGKKVAVNSMSMCAEYVLKEYFRRKQVSAVPQFVLVPDPKQVVALAEQAIDVSAVHSPYFEQVVATGAARELFNDFALDDGLSGMVPYFTSEAFIATHPDVIRRFLKVLVRAIDWTNEHHAEAVRIFAAKRGLDARYDTSWDYYEHGVVPGDAPVQWWIDVLVRNGKLERDQVRAKDVYTNEFLPLLTPAAPTDSDTGRVSDVRLDPRNPPSRAQGAR